MKPLPNDHLDPGLRPLDDLLSSLAEGDRSAPDAGFEPRVLGAIDHALTPEPIRIETHRPRWALAVRTAAGIALIASVGTVSWLAMRPGVKTSNAAFTLASAESDVELLAELFESDDTGPYDAMAGEIELVGSEAADDPFWTTFEALSGSLEQGAI